MKKFVSIVLCLVLVLSLSAAALAKEIGGAVGGGGLVIGGNKNVTAFIDKVNEIGDPVTLADGPIIEEAYELAFAPISSTSTNTVYAVYLDRNSQRVNGAGADAWDKLEAANEAYQALLNGGAEEKPTTPPADEPNETPTEAPTQAPTEAPTKPGIQIPTEAPTQAPTQAPTETPVDPAGDNTFMVMALVMLSMTALVVLVSKKRIF